MCSQVVAVPSPPAWSAGARDRGQAVLGTRGGEGRRTGESTHQPRGLATSVTAETELTTRERSNLRAGAPHAEARAVPRHLRSSGPAATWGACGNPDPSSAALPLHAATGCEASGAQAGTWAIKCASDHVCSTPHQWESPCPPPEPLVCGRRLINPAGRPCSAHPAAAFLGAVGTSK